jgi:hypothetical protein
MTSTDELLVYVQKRIKELTKIKKEMLAAGNHASAQYTEGALDTYDIIRIKLEGKVEFIEEEEDK